MSVFSGLVPDLRPFAVELLRIAQVNDLHPRVTSVRRTRAEQTRLYNRWRAGLNPYPVAVPGTSAHEVGLAFDMVSDNNAALGALWQSWGGRWGGATDPVHFTV